MRACSLRRDPRLALGRRAAIDEQHRGGTGDHADDRDGIDICELHRAAVTGRIWKDTAFGGARGRTDVPKIVEWHMQGKVQIDPMITHVMSLAGINNAFELMKRGESIRGVVTF
jgi:Zn-dependent alcohol dehydrogenase